mgnify:CR=1 FL=1
MAIASNARRARTNAFQADDRARRSGRISSPSKRSEISRYGENPHQKAAWYRNAVPAASGFSAGGCPAGQGAVLSRISSISTPRPASRWNSPSRRRSSIKHTNPCGAAIGESAGRRLRPRARRRQPRRVRRNRRAEPTDRRGGGRGDRVDVHRGRDRPGPGPGCAPAASCRGKPTCASSSPPSTPS